MRTVAILLMALFVNSFAQITGAAPDEPVPPIWQIPFASTGNTISLTVQNSSNVEAKMVSVKFSNVPSWMEFESRTVLIKSIAAKASGDAGFTFSVDRKAPIGRDTTLTAVISMANGQSRSKTIEIEVSAPKDYKLYNNFPNPFNPSTKIAFQLPRESHVELIIYDITGREVARVTDRDYPAGYNEVTWNGLNGDGQQVSSGVYFYRVSAGNWSAVRKMMVLK